jgi:ubiquinone/menaquinone biosynthesis C-methylase UbiE
LTLNVGCGKERIGDVRLDFVAGSAANIIGDAQHLPFRDGVFIEVYERNVLEHMANPGQHLTEIRRVLREGGLLRLITDNAACLKYYLLRTHTGGYSKHGGKDKHYALFTMEHVRNLMQVSGFEVERLEFIGTTYFTRFFDLFVRLFMPALSYSRILVEARRN